MIYPVAMIQYRAAELKVRILNLPDRKVLMRHRTVIIVVGSQIARFIFPIRVNPERLPVLAKQLLVADVKLSTDLRSWSKRQDWRVDVLQAALVLDDQIPHAADEDLNMHVYDL